MNLISVHCNGTVGVAQELADYLTHKGEPVGLLEHPYSPIQKRPSRLRIFEKGKLWADDDIGQPPRTQMGLYAASFWVTLRVVWQRRREVTRFFAHSNVDCIAARLAGNRHMRLVYVSIDYSPARFPKQPFLSWVYRVLDRMAYQLATVIWHSYPDATRLKPYAKAEKCFQTLHGNNFKRIHRVPWAEREQHRLVYLGNVHPGAHIEDALLSIKSLRKEIPDITLSVIGVSESPMYLQRLKDSAEGMGIADRVTWHGLISESEEYEKILTRCGLALCLYEVDKDHHSYYQISGKIFAYAACGLPVLVLEQSGPATVREVTRVKMGVVTTVDKVVLAMRDLLTQPARHEEMSAKAERWGAAYDWRDKFEKYLSLIPG